MEDRIAQLRMAGFVSCQREDFGFASISRVHSLAAWLTVKAEVH